MIFIESKVTRQTVILFSKLQSTRALRIYFSINASIESSSSYFFCKVNSFKVWRYHFCSFLCRSMITVARNQYRHVLFLWSLTSDLIGILRIWRPELGITL